MKVGALVQARMNSRRCPGKVLRRLGGTTVLGQLLDNLSQCRQLAGICVATSCLPQDDAVEQLVRQHAGRQADAEDQSGGTPSISVARGSLEDVAARFEHALSALHWDGFVRVSGDSPLLDYRLVDRAAGLLKSEQADLVSNVRPRSFPRGQSVEALTVEAFRRGMDHARSADDKEHVTPYFYEHPDTFRRHHFHAPQDHSAIQLAIDTEEDYAVVTSVVANLSRPVADYPWPVLAVLSEDFRAFERGVAV